MIVVLQRRSRLRTHCTRESLELRICSTYAEVRDYRASMARGGEAAIKKVALIRQLQASGLTTANFAEAAKTQFDGHKRALG